LLGVKIGQALVGRVRRSYLLVMAKETVVPSEKPSAPPPATKPATPKPGAKPAEHGGPSGPEPTRYGDWEKNGRCIDF
jgi:hypothetical protein